MGYAVTAVVANTANEAVDCLTLEELARAWSPEAEGAITDWRQVREALPARTLTAYGPEADLPTFDFFTARVVGEAGAVRLDYVAGPAPQLVRSLAQDPGALAFVDLNTYLENRSALRLLAVDDGAGCVLPEPALRRAVCGLRGGRGRGVCARAPADPRCTRRRAPARGGARLHLDAAAERPARR
ncbi:MAG: hypothetical protein M5R40_13920 [Anaerolineae bacterium]|nr:hypothetical protein [Anaerolineae bacterium]